MHDIRGDPLVADQLWIEETPLSRLGDPFFVRDLVPTARDGVHLDGFVVGLLGGGLIRVLTHARFWPPQPDHRTACHVPIDIDDLEVEPVRDHKWVRVRDGFAGG